jgi:alpha-methylacyl-CoA racemase
MGPLAGVSVLELRGLGPGPFCGMVLGGLGADVVRVDRVGDVPDDAPADPPADVLERGKRSIALDLKRAEGVEAFLRLAERSDALIDPYRPGVAERLGIGPAECLARSHALVYGRMTGWGQDGPYAQMAGHDIDYIAITGVLDAIGRRGGPPVPPLNLVGDFGGGGMLLAVGLLAALLEASRSGEGQVVDAAMVDGAALLSALFFGSQPLGEWRPERGTNLLDSGAPFYDVYATADGRYVAVGAIEPHFYEQLLRGIGLDGDPTLPGQYDRERWPELREHLAARFATRTRDDWCAALEGTDACVAPVLTFAEAPDHPHNRRRGVYAAVGGRPQPRPAPRFGRTPADDAGIAPHAGEHTAEVLAELAYGAGEVEQLLRAGAARTAAVTSTTGGRT